MTPLSAQPSSLAVATTETKPILFDLSRQLLSGETVTSPTSSLLNITTGGLVVLTDAPTVIGKGIQQIIRGSVLVAGNVYQLVVGYTAATNKVITNDITITCPR